jgi:NAD(P)-dependent dehydrogenase (short-subunit alcohol dehydrogenase family)
MFIAMATQKWTEADMPDQSGRVAIVTGANTGLGYDTARALAAHGAHVVLAVRDTAKGAAAAARIAKAVPTAKLAVQELDLGSLASIRTAAGELGRAYPRIDLLINNAGVMYTSPRQVTSDGFEVQFGTNHLGHFALTGLLIECLLPVEGSRIVTVASNAHKQRAAIHFDDLQWERHYDRHAAYGQSKLANLLFHYELQRQLATKNEPTIAVAAHPGLSSTDLMRHLPGVVRPFVPLVAQSPADGALPTLLAATAPTVRGGQYYGPDGIGEWRGVPKLVRSTRQSHDEDLQRRLWAVSEDLTGVVYPL